MNQFLPPSAIYCLAGIILLITGSIESYLGARRENEQRVRGGFGLVTIGAMFFVGGVVLWIIGTR
jgi:hypothetical protein